MTSLHHWEQDLRALKSLEDLEAFRLSYLGKSGALTTSLKELGKLSPEDRKARGAELNAIRNQMTAALNDKKTHFEDIKLNAQMSKDKIDVTLPPAPKRHGRIHILSQVMDDIYAHFQKLGFELRDGPDIDTEVNNFDALNIPSHHPARQNHDTFYVDSPNFLLRTHTSNIQIHTLKNQKPPLRCLAYGRAYRSDDIDATHTPMFHQMEGFVVDKNIHFGHLKSTLIEFCREFFGHKHLNVRFRPSFFPFTEPSAEVDIGCHKDRGVLKIGEGDDWLEILGCGMIHPNVLTHCGIDPNEYQGFAFGMGIERLAMLKYGISDIRHFYDCDDRFLSHFGAIA